MTIYRCTWEFDAYTEFTPYFRTEEKAKDYFWNMIHEKGNDILLAEVQAYYNDCHEEDESFKEFVYAVLDGWDICGYETAELID